MIIACTHDLAIRASLSLTSAAAWGTSILLGADDTQAAAEAQLTQSLGNINPGEPLCVAAHQNADGFGDADGEWTWSAAEFAKILQAGLPKTYNSPVLIYAVSHDTASFANDLTSALRTAGALCGVKVYGFKAAVTVETTPYPNPGQLANDQDLNGTVVQC